MSSGNPANFEMFLVEDMVLTLANLRGSLGWIATGGDPLRHGAGVARLDRQLEAIEDRARDLCRELQSRATQRPPAALGRAAPAGRAREGYDGQGEWRDDSLDGWQGDSGPDAQGRTEEDAEDDENLFTAGFGDGFGDGGGDGRWPAWPVFRSCRSRG